MSYAQDSLAFSRTKSLIKEENSFPMKGKLSIDLTIFSSEDEYPFTTMNLIVNGMIESA